MAIIKQNGSLVSQDYIDKHFHKKCVLLLYHGENLPAGYGYLEFASDATDNNDKKEDTEKLLDMLMETYDADGIVVSGFTGGGVEYVV
jgi:hypothetical protein